ncbi:uncharacterized protein EV154DRAFT_547026 [Mucor mucedo]|uniref:uncharacterized protein n=1 Tax=Mucor mucedo TaxID=29922 RepID=UPI002220C4F4|nr:uncharacterized protein EV154DRAFT_547026 [Mucor mucedo]KAI7896751.1 hypothetical protein EV154DRAFT_547026 [Mucor mucedo]
MYYTLLSLFKSQSYMVPKFDKNSPFCEFFLNYMIKIEMPKKSYIDDVANINLYRESSHVDAEKWINVGYARKSNTKESDHVRQRLLTAMINKLKTKLLCQKVFVSPISNADNKFINRDKDKRTLKFMPSLKCDGTTEDLLLYLSSETRLVRLVSIDYAGLSTNLGDLRSFVSDHKCIKEIVIDKGHHVEVFPRKQLLKDDETLLVFRCRNKPVNRSK